MITELFFPTGLRCAVCGQRVRGTLLCARCSGRLPRMHDAACALCGRAVRQGTLCEDCAREPPPLDGCVSALCYEDLAQELILRYKFHSQAQLRFLLSDEMARALRVMPWADRVQCVAAVPLHPLRWLRRGYNQSALVARLVAKNLGVPYLWGALRRVRYERPSASLHLGRKTRLARSRGAFATGKAGRLQGKTVLLIDDVMTTGATLYACAAVLRNGGAAHVYGAVIAAARYNKEFIDKATPLQ